MFVIGIVDVTTVGSTLCQRRINELGGPLGDHPEFVVHSIPFIEYRSAIISKDWKKVAELISLSIEKLSRLNVDFVIVPSITPHYAYDNFSRNSPLPVLNLIEVTAQACQEAKVRRVAILGTKSTMMGGLYKQKIESKDMMLVIPSEESCDAIDKFILEEIVPGKVNECTRLSVLKLIQAIDCDGFILGCTELPEVYSARDLCRVAIDTTQLIAEVAFKIAKEENHALTRVYR